MTTHFINGQWQQGLGQLFVSTDPAKNREIWQGRAATEAQVDTAYQAARTAFEPWADLSFTERSEVVKNFANKLTEHKEALALTIAEETGKPLWEPAPKLAAMIWQNRYLHPGLSGAHRRERKPNATRPCFYPA